MHFENSDLFVSFKHISALTPKKLEQLMLQIQLDAGQGISFSPPTYNLKTNKYETWYLYDHSKDIRPVDKLKNNKGVK